MRANAPAPLALLTASALTALGLALVIANWVGRPEVAPAWTAAIAMFVVMAVALWRSQAALRRSPEDAAFRRSAAATTRAVVFGAITMIIPLVVTLARAYGIVDDPDLGRRWTGVLTGAFLVALGNTMPKTLPPLSSTACDGARQQAFQRFAGWTWVLCGLGITIGWLTLPLDVAGPLSMALVVTAMVLTIVHLLRLRRARPTAPKLS